MTTRQTTIRNAEGRAILAAIGDTAPNAPTACSGWTAHDLVAHLAAGAKEIADLIQWKLDGRPDRPTRGFAEREAPFRAMDHDELTRRLVEENKRKLTAYAALAELDDPSLAFTGTRLTLDRLAVQLPQRSRHTPLGSRRRRRHRSSAVGPARTHVSWRLGAQRHADPAGVGTRPRQTRRRGPSPADHHRPAHRRPTRRRSHHRSTIPTLSARRRSGLA